MKLLDRYLLRSYLGPVFYCLTAFSMIFIISELLGKLAKLMDADPRLPEVALYYVCVLTPTLEYIAPASLLLATLYTLWQLSRQNELTAMRACGISQLRMMMPFLGVGVAFSLTTSVIKETVAPRAAVWAREFSDNRYRVPEYSIQQNVAHYNTAGNRLWLIGVIDLKRPGRLEDVKVTQEREDGTRLMDILTPLAEWLDGRWWFHNAMVQEYDRQDNPVGRPKPLAPGDEPVCEMTEIEETPTDFAIGLRDWEDLSALQMWRYLDSHPRISKSSRAEKMYDIHAHLAMPWACFIVTLFGIPAGAKGARHSALTGVFVAVAFFFGFYTLSQVGLFMGKRQLLSPWIGAWLSNMVFLVTGLIMLRRTR